MATARSAYAARFISSFTVPPLIAAPIFTLLGLYDQAHSGGSTLDLWVSLFFSITFSSTLPSIFIIFLYRHKKVTDLDISVRQQRSIPYAVGIGCSLIGAGFIYWLLGPGVVVAFMLVNAVNGVIVTVINLYWKISAHAIGIGGPLAVLTLLFGWIILPLFLVLPLVGWARVHIRAHTLAQVIAGSIVGFSLTFLQLALIYRPLNWF